MKIDAEIRNALTIVVAEEGQSEGVTKKLIAWLESIAEGNENADDMRAAEEHIKLIFDELSVTIDDQG
jgi:hypothetical protein